MALKRPNLMLGMVTLKKVFKVPAPRLSEASYRRASVLDKATSRIMKAGGKVKTTSAMTIPEKSRLEMIELQHADLKASTVEENGVQHTMAYEFELPVAEDKPEA